MTIKPKKFVGLHSHTHFSIGDGLGTPEEHIRFAVENGMDGLACTDHGNMNAYSHQQAAAKKYGDSFFAVPGIEAYFIPSLSDWSNLKQRRDQEKAEAKELEKLAKAKKKPKAKDNEEDRQLPFELADSQTAMSKEDIEETLGGTVVENENESKSKYLDPIKQRSHLVLLPKNREGLEAIFRLVSESYINGFYRYPRIDFDLLKKYAKGNIVALSACISGEAVLTTKNGIRNLEEVVKSVSSGAEVEVLCFNEKTKKKEFKKVKWGKKTKKNTQVYEVTLEDGKKIKATLDHKFLCDRGWLTLEEILALTSNAEKVAIHTI